LYPFYLGHEKKFRYLSENVCHTNRILNRILTDDNEVFKFGQQLNDDSLTIRSIFTQRYKLTPKNVIGTLKRIKSCD